jgi:nitrite reductase (NADH) small subunit
MNDACWIRVTTCDSVPPREGRAVTLGDREIAVFNLGPSTALGAGDRFLATDNRCPHRSGPLCDGIVTGAAVVCPLHTWKINLETGAVERPASADACIETYPIRVVEGIVWIDVRRAGLALQTRQTNQADVA